MRKHKLSLAIPSLVLMLFVGAVPKHLAQQDIDEEYKIYSAILKAKFQPSIPLITGNKEPTLMIMNRTYSHAVQLTAPDRQVMLNKLAPLSNDTLENYNSTRQTELQLKHRFDTKAKVLLMDERQVSDIFREEGVRGWDTLRKKYPRFGGIISFSRVGFNEKKSQAFIRVSHQCDGLCGSGFYYVLERVGEEWEIKNELLLWIS